MALSWVLLAASFALLLGGAVVFTNAVEWAGARMKLGGGAVGSVLAAVATGLPESTIPVVAILTGEQAGEIAIGSIIGAPFLLGTLAMALVGLAARGFAGRREQRAELHPHRDSTRRDLSVFLVFLAVALVLGLTGPRLLRVVASGVFVLGYVAYVWRTLARGGDVESEDELRPMYFDTTKSDPPSTPQIVLQVLVGIGMIVGGAELFVTEIEHIATALGLAALVLALVLVPLASELPEKVNSVLWVRRGKDALALGNITGAMVFQSMIPVSVGMAFTQWRLSLPAVVTMVCALAGGALALLVVRRSRRFPPGAVAGWLTLYGGAVGVVFGVT